MTLGSRFGLSVCGVIYSHVGNNGNYNLFAIVLQLWIPIRWICMEFASIAIKFYLTGISRKLIWVSTTVSALPFS